MTLLLATSASLNLISELYIRKPTVNWNQWEVAAKAQRMATDWRLVIHGGAGAMRPKNGDADHEERARDGLRAALEVGAAILEHGGAALDAVEASVRILEDDPCFNAGRGSALTDQGTVELDAAIMDGRNRRAG